MANVDFVDSAINENYFPETFFEVASSHVSQFEKLGINSNRLSEELVNRFGRLNNDQKVETMIQLSISNQIVDEMVGSNPEVIAGDERFCRLQEIAFMEKSLRARKLRVADPGFLDLIDEGDIIEVYDSRAIQIFRSWSYFKYCSYSLIELLIHDWDELYQRPSWVAKQLWEIAPKLFQPGARTIKYDLPEYVLTERLKRPSRALMFKMKYASPITHVETGEIYGFVTTGELRAMPNVKIGVDVAFI